MSDADTVLVLAAAYDSVQDAEVDYEAIKSLYMEVQTSKGLGWGLAVGAVMAIHPAIGLVGGMVAGGGAGAAIGP